MAGLREDVRQNESRPHRLGQEGERRLGGRGTLHPLRVQLEEEVEARVQVDAG